MRAFHIQEDLFHAEVLGTYTHARAYTYTQKQPYFIIYIYIYIKYKLGITLVGVYTFGVPPPCFRRTHPIRVC